MLQSMVSQRVRHNLATEQQQQQTLRDFSSPTSDGTHVPCIVSSFFTTGPPGKSLVTCFLTGRIWQNGRDMNSVIPLQEAVISASRLHRLCGLCALEKQVTLLERPTWQGSEGDLWSAVREKLNRGYGFRRGSLSSQACR